MPACVFFCTLLHPSCSETTTQPIILPPLLPHRSAVSEMLTLVFHCTPFPSPLTHSCLKAHGDGVLIVCTVCLSVIYFHLHAYSLSIRMKASVQLVMMSRRRCLGLWELLKEMKKKKSKERKKSIVVCINHAAATENYGNMS